MTAPIETTHALPLYFDYMATTPVDPRVVSRMMNYLGPEGIYGNPASTTHVYGKMAALAVDEARATIAQTVHAEPQALIFTSGATEANNLAILGAARFYQRKGKHVITMVTEHKAVLDSFQQLEREGFQVTYLTPESTGLLNSERLLEAITPETILVSIMQVNNEIGVVQDIEAIAHLLANQGMVFHVDAAQSAGKIAINLKETPVSLMSFSAHKNYGPKGIGALFVRQKPRIRLQPQLFGGSQEGGLRPGTLATHQIVGMSEAFAIAEANREEEQARLRQLRDRLWDGIKNLPGIQLNGHPEQRIAGNLNISFAGIQADSLMDALHELALSSTSACESARTQPSYVLQAIGLSRELAYSSIRLSLGRFTTEQEVIAAISIINYQINRLHSLSPQ